MNIKLKFSKNSIIIASSILVFLIITVLIIYAVYFYYQNTIQSINEISKIDNIEKNNQEKCEIRRKLDGVCTENGQENLWPAAIMVDNHPDSWPQSGLSQAQIVYNTLVEGGATRLMAVFTTHEEIEKIGPVRSARPYYLTWAKELNALFGHSGGSPEALKKIKQYQIIDWEEATSYGPLYFWRDKTKLSPHDLFTSNEKISNARIDWELFDKIPDYTNWQFNSINSTTELTLEFSPKTSIQVINNIYIDYSPGILFDVEYQYNTSTKNYLRFQNNAPHFDALTGQQIAVKNVIIQFVPNEIHLDAEDRLRIETIGQGKAWIFYDNKMTQGVWVKNSLEERTMFYDEDGKEIIFMPGNIWVEVVPGKREVKISQ